MVKITTVVGHLNPKQEKQLQQFRLFSSFVSFLAIFSRPRRAPSTSNRLRYPKLLSSPLESSSSSIMPPKVMAQKDTAKTTRNRMKSTLPLNPPPPECMGVYGLGVKGLKNGLVKGLKGLMPSFDFVPAGTLALFAWALPLAWDSLTTSKRERAETWSLCTSRCFRRADARNRAEDGSPPEAALAAAVSSATASAAACMAACSRSFPFSRWSWIFSTSNSKVARPEKSSEARAACPCPCSGRGEAACSRCSLPGSASAKTALCSWFRA
mmetsp:Transcript_63402/g.100830  ORF Transcript_63402/g.100830 Transcript_63402/m.100830 type:complete len:268 (-) Transcript_63402:149-952(-)